MRRARLPHLSPGPSRATSAPLPQLARLQAAFGPHDLRGVAAHLQAPAPAGALSARAYTVGESVHFMHAPTLHTVAHEATHVVQQRQGRLPPGGRGRPGDALEREADAVASRVVAGGQVGEMLGRAASPLEAGAAVAVQCSFPPPDLSALMDLDSPKAWHLTLRSPGTDPEWQQRLLQLSWAVEDARSTVPILSMRPKRKNGRLRGYQYVDRAVSRWEATQTLDTLGVPGRDAATRFLWSAFEHLLGREGDSASMNSYDNQLVTLGHGFSLTHNRGRSNFVQRLAGLPRGALRRAHAMGIHFSAEGLFSLLDTSGGQARLLTGNDALRWMQHQPALLSLLVAFANAETPTRDHDGVTRPQRTLVLRAQFEEFQQRNRAVTPEVLESRPLPVIIACVLMRHWMGGFDQSGGLRRSSVDGVLDHAIHQLPNKRDMFEERRDRFRRRVREATGAISRERFASSPASS
ncbi:MAG: DUF4157 domain-containing protein [Alphaproteobacteria bacterium]|nr:DUF4157 domain-containing protein [Alphaproteobacteria bacterium]MCB9794937.1 DUF4157 domain-containing protein [Alphaproteobacteria bacterium]